MFASTMTMDPKDWAKLNPRGTTLAIVRKGKNVIAVVWGDDEEEEKATAVKFASTDDLLAALKEIRNVGFGGDDNMARLALIASAAIAKATDRD